jgi:hypothetical protein
LRLTLSAAKFALPGPEQSPVGAHPRDTEDLDSSLTT